jgi:hypothetical protein
MKRRGGVHVAALDRRDQSADGKNGKASVTPAPARKSLRVDIVIQRTFKVQHLDRLRHLGREGDGVGACRRLHHGGT